MLPEQRKPIHEWVVCAASGSVPHDGLAVKRRLKLGIG